MKILIFIFILFFTLYGDDVKIKYTPRKAILKLNGNSYENGSIIQLPQGQHKIQMILGDSLLYSDSIVVNSIKEDRVKRYRINTDDRFCKEIICSFGAQLAFSKYGKLGQIGTVDLGLLTRNDFYWGLYMEAASPGGLLLLLKEKEWKDNFRTAIGGSFGILWNMFGEFGDVLIGEHIYDIVGTNKFTGIEARFILGKKSHRLMLRSALMVGWDDLYRYDEWDAKDYNKSDYKVYPAISLAVTFRNKRGYRGVTGSHKN